MVSMVAVRARAADGRPTHRILPYAAVMAGLALAGAYLWSAGHQGSGHAGYGAEVPSPRSARTGPAAARARGDADAPQREEEPDEEDADPLRIAAGSVAYGEGGDDLAYYRCGPLPSADDPAPTELVLLHGAAFTKEDWRSSGILARLCAIDNEEDEGNLSVTALDLPVKADGRALGSAFDALTARKVLSGRAAAFVSPSASRKALVGLGEMTEGGGGGSGGGGEDDLARVVRAWIPVAAGAVLGASDAALRRYEAADIPILAIHGDQDGRGKEATKRLTELVGAEGVELKGRHPVYLDSPEEFVAEVLRFLDERGL